MIIILYDKDDVVMMHNLSKSFQLNSNKMFTFSGFLNHTLKRVYMTVKLFVFLFISMKQFVIQQNETLVHVLMTNA